MSVQQSTLLALNSLKVVVDDKKVGSVTLDHTDIAHACIDGDQRAAQQALLKYRDLVDPKIAALVAEYLPADQLQIDIRLKMGRDTVDVGEIAKKTLVKAITAERLLNNDATVVAKVDWMSYGLMVDNNPATCVVKLQTRRDSDRPEAKPGKRLVESAKKVFVVRPPTSLVITNGTAFGQSHVI